MRDSTVFETVKDSAECMLENFLILMMSLTFILIKSTMVFAIISFISLDSEI